MPPRQVSFQATVHPQPKGQIILHPHWAQTWGNTSTDHNHATIPTMTGAAAVTKGTYCAPHPATAVAHAALWLIDTAIATCMMTHPRHSCTTSHTTTSPTDITHATIPQTIASLAPATLTTL